MNPIHCVSEMRSVLSLIFSSKAKIPFKINYEERIIGISLRHAFIREL